MEEGETEMSGYNFGKFMAQYHDLKRAHKVLETKLQKREAMVYELRVELMSATRLLRLGGYTDAASKTHDLLIKINKEIMEEIK